MNVKKFTLFVLPILVVGVSAFTLFEKAESKYFPRESDIIFNNSSKFFEEFTRMVRANRETGVIDPVDVLMARKHVNKMKLSKNFTFEWGFRGPDNIGGRTRALAIDRNNPNHMFAGAVSGGLWESFDGGNEWEPYDENFEVTTISCITQDANGDFYIGTGSHFERPGNPLSSNIIRRGSAFIGSGIYKVAGGGTYEPVVTTDESGGRGFPLPYATVGNIAADPVIPGKLYVAANHGFRILEKKNGTWEDTTSINYPEKCLDVEVGSDGKMMVIFKQPGGIGSDSARVYTSSDGVNWNMTQFDANRIEGAIAPSNTDIMYLSATGFNPLNSQGNPSDPNDVDHNCLKNVYRSSDGGLTWYIIGPGGSSSFEPFNVGGGCQGYWDNLMAVAPNDPGKIFVGGVILFTWEQSTTDPAPPNGSWRRLDVITNRYADPQGALDPRYLHSDKHLMVFHPNNRNIAYIATDGGVARSSDILATQPTFAEYNNNYGTAQFFNFDVNQNDLMLGGTQDNGSNLVGLKYNRNKSGLQVFGGDGYDAELSVINPEIGIATLYNNQFARIQGIGTTLGNTNISRANILTGFYSNLNNNRMPQYTVTHFWESFNHAASADRAEVLYERKNLPPIPQDTIIQFEGNNNDVLQFDTLTQDAYPFDTAIGGVDTTIVNWQIGNSNRVIANFDTIYFDRNGKFISVVRRGQADTLINYQLNRTYSFSNVVSNPRRTFVDIINDSTYRVRRNQVTFRYKLQMQDKVQSILATANWPGLTNDVAYNQRHIVISRDILKNTTDIRWYDVAGPRSTPDPIQDGNTILCMNISKDGNYLFAGTINGDLYRISGLNQIYNRKFVNVNGDTIVISPSVSANLYAIQERVLIDSCKKIGRFTGRAITDIAIDPNDPNNLIVALGNYGNSQYVARTTIALTATDPSTSFEVISGTGSNALPAAPAFSALIDGRFNERVLLGTEMGVFISENAFSAPAGNVTWTKMNENLGSVPVYGLAQLNYGVVYRTVLDTVYVPGTKEIDTIIPKRDSTYFPNEGKIYAATHGRGFFEEVITTSSGRIGDRRESVDTHFENGLKIYPNPVRDQTRIEFKLANRADVRIQIYNLNGRLVRDEQYSNQTEGKNSVNLDLTDLSNGTYVIRAISEDRVSSSKLILYK